MKHVSNTGSWILIKNSIPIETPIPPMSMWFAVPTEKKYYVGEKCSGWVFDDDKEKINKLVKRYFSNDHAFFKDLVYTYSITNYLPAIYAYLMPTVRDAIKEFNIKIEQQVKIINPWGECIVEPHEYTILDNINNCLEYVKGDIATIKIGTKLINDLVYTNKDIKQLEQYTKTILTDKIFWFEFNEDIRHTFTYDVDVYKNKRKQYKIKKWNPHTRAFFYD